MLKELQDIGLSEKEARVYLASLELGPATADNLAKQSKIVRSTTYVQLEALMKVGLMSTYEEGKKTFFAPESPELLRRLLSKQKDQINSKEQYLTQLLPELLRHYEGAGERPVVRFFPGKEGIATVREEALLAREKQLYVVFSSEATHKVFTQKEIDDYSDKRTALGIRSKGLYTHKGYFDRAEEWLNEFTEGRYVPNLPLTIDIRIFDNKTAIVSLKGNIFALVIESEQIASSMKMIFNFLWEHAEKK